MSSVQLIKQPVITEKTLKLQKDDWYCFVVDKAANKQQIKEAVEKLFSVKVKRVRTIIVKGRTKRTGRSRQLKRLPSYKKAMVQLDEGKIELMKMEGS